MKISSGVKNINLVEGIPFFVRWSEDEQGLYSYTFYYENPIDGQWEEFLDVEGTKDWILTKFESALPSILEDIRVVRKTIDEFVKAAEKVMAVNGS